MNQSKDEGALEFASFKLPFPYNVASRLGDRWRRSIMPIDAERYCRTAERITGLDDYGPDDGFRERLEASVEGLGRLDFNLIGRLACRTMHVWHIINRLNVVEALAQNPGVEERDIGAPIVVVGMFRTGTTFLHNVLAADPGSRAGKMWEVSYPVGRKRAPLADFGWRYRRTSIPTFLNRTVIPDQDVIHRVSTDEYEEDFFMLGTDMVLMTQFIGLGDWDYAWRLLDEDLSGAYRWHRLQLQLLDAQRQGAGRRWVLKCPWHMWNLDALLTAYPDAKIIHTHRDPVKAMGSQASLTSRIVCRMHRDVPAHEVSSFWVDYSLAGLERGQAVKDRLPPSQVCDVRLQDLRQAPGETIRRIYEQFEIPCGDELVATFDAKAATDPTFQHGTHEYSLEEFGLDAATIGARFADYKARFGV